MILENYSYVYINLFEHKNINQLFLENQNLDYQSIKRGLENELLLKMVL